MARKLKVYRWLSSATIPKDHPIRKDSRFQEYRNQFCFVMAAPSKAAVGRALNVPPRQLFNLCETWNDHDTAVAMASPGTIFIGTACGGPPALYEIEVVA